MKFSNLKLTEKMILHPETREALEIIIKNERKRRLKEL
ncbi:hypothetical protein SAMD00020551_1177 [Mesobacillus selenatarsenatis SF-1]|uniref:Uncharacterized protein n=1 Tax=Mesobacillus selenatarsenatis (strain DSM 18680 / JCM 14380 / FERM P-15431 / SF-1) TaxID=1321606 RepID=A0A0A8X4H3_MESS1|nr:hypothetical protein SAMD00020551_1177 [Mesobacillus selenatarsenatis SF-1]